jgi:hypothetical protein
MADRSQPDLVNGADVGMVQRRSGLRFALETGKSLGIFGNVIRQKLESDKPVQRYILGPCRLLPSLRRRASRRCGSAR